MKLYLERFLLSILASLFTLVLTGKTNPAFRVAAIATVAVLAFLAAVVAERFPSADASQKALSRRQPLVLVLLSMGVLLLAAYVLLRRPDMFQTAQEGSKNPPGQPVDGPKLRVEGGRPTIAPGETPPSSEDSFIRKYVADDGQPYRTGAWTVVISAAGPNSFPGLYAAAENALSEKGYAVRPLFRAALLQDSAAVDELYTGNPALLKRIGTYRDGFVVGKLRSEVTQNPALDMFTAHLYADLRVISARSARVEGQLTIDETGAGFSEAAATTAAEHRLADKLKQQLLQSIPPK